MTTRDEIVCHALLDLGLEDWIPIPEAVASPEVVNAVGAANAPRAVQNALKLLLKEGRLLLYRGPWDAEPAPVPLSEALNLLADDYWYGFHADAEAEVRLYFVNVLNIRSGNRGS